MSNITIVVSQEELDFIREALALKYRTMINYLDMCEGDSSSKTDSVLSQAYESLSKEIADHKKELAEIERVQNEWTVTTTDKGNMVAAVKKRGRPRKSADAPYGYKKDGTPKKRPGRPAA